MASQIRVDSFHAGRKLSLVLLVASRARDRHSLESLLAHGGYSAVSVNSGQEALRVLNHETCHLILLQHVHDMTPEMLCQKVRHQVAERVDGVIPIISLSERFDPDEVIRCFHAGADDCVTGPHLESRVLLARIEAAVQSCRRWADYDLRSSEQPVRVGGIVIDPVKRRVYVHEHALDLTRIQYHLLYTMARRPGLVFSQARLRGTIVRQGGSPEEGSVKSHISHLRRRLGSAAGQIETVRGMGYRLAEPS